ncbi:hypothetical protein AMQ84_19425 [Paenibacillus riograndensis]|uniref:Uncharacterized protein n=1 Tax=Paenibacillus riograndensis TaxID=483937 RepID=A0A132TTD0_9BACL|nr:hypothetical protein [Paenibacillus riograndensis]KWX74599.1 hypothetical protein AMQ84_19425 [Paenibacillus riograndensis]
MSDGALVAPFEIIPFEIMTKKEAKQYFDWFVLQIPTRIDTLIAHYVETLGGGKEELDLSQESLVNLWKWFIQRIEMVPKTKEELEEDVDAAPDWLKEEVANNTLKFSEFTSSLIIDVGIYFGSVFLNEMRTLEWGIIHKPKKYVYVNRPIIIGFKEAGLNPIAVVNNCSLRELNQDPDDTRLFNLFNVWKGYL